MADVMMTLGRYTFGLDTAAFQEMNRNTEWRWPGQDVFGSRPALQFTGWGDDTITLPGVIFPEYWGGTGQLNALRALGDSGQSQTLIDGRGNVLGQWVITGVQERQGTFAQRGVGRRQEFTVTLKRYGTDNLAALPAVVAGTLAAAASAVSVGTTAGLTSTVSQATAKAGQAVGTLTAMKAKLEAGLGNAREILGAVGVALGEARNLQSTARQAQAAIKAAGNITSLTTAQSAVSGLLQVSSQTTAVATRASGTISGAIDSMTSAGADLASMALAKSAQLEVNRLAVAATQVRASTETAVRGFAS